VGRAKAPLQQAAPVAEPVDTGRLVKVGMPRAMIPTATSAQNGCSWAQAGI
jgi:hypothetical protein